MPEADRTSSDVLGVVGGAEGSVVGWSFIPENAFAELRWGGRGMPELAVAACSRLSPDFAFVPSWEVWADEASDRIAACGVCVLWAVPGPLGLIAQRDGWGPTLKRTLSDIEALRGDLEAELPAIEEAVRRGVSLGATAIVVAEDMGTSSSMLFSPDFAMGELLPVLARITETAAELSIPSILHTDGEVRAVLRAVRHSGFMALHSGGLTEEGFSRLFDAARSEDLAVLGGVLTPVLDTGPIAAVASGTHLSVLARRGGLLVCDDGGITTGEQLASLFSALEAVRGRDR